MEAPDGDLPQILCLLRDSVPLDQEDLDACFDPERFGRKTNPAQEEAIASQWRRASRANPRLFNGSKFRYAGLQWCSDRPQLQLGLTSYREHVGTNLRAGQRQLQQAGEAVHGDPQAFLADPLAVGAALLTSDNRVILVRRALWVGEYPGLVDRPGGHAEPDELPRPSSAEESPAAEERHRAALSEVFESVRREVRDELGVPLTHISRPYLAGVLRDRGLGGRPTLEFILRCSLPSTDLERLYNEGKHCEADESLGLVILTRDELFSEQRSVFRVPDLAELLGVEYPWRTAKGDSAIGEGEGSGEDARDGPQSDEAVTSVTADSCGPAVNCDVSGTSEVVANCESAASSSPAPAAVTAEVPCQDSKVPPAESRAEPPPPAAKPRQQPPKKRRRNKKDKRCPARQEKAVEDPAPEKEADTATKESTEPVSDLQTAADPQTTDEPAVQSSDPKPTDCQNAKQNPNEDHQKENAEDEAAPGTEQPVALSETPAAAEDTKPSAASAEAAPDVVPSKEPSSLPPSTAEDGSGPEAGASDEVVVVQQNGVVLIKSGEEVTETTMPSRGEPTETSPPSQIETHAEVVNNPEGAEPTGAGAEKTPEELEREKKAQLWKQMTPGCKAALALLKAANLKGFVFRF
ncbi:Uridine diphosphate glucose pyrophosphatase [Amphibalanus amphitrite]|uniref:Uridine diphosphate glucose pyrophosphatase n=1 Tax=Amphibalanus amphitrite TaxID=1232801 RepID=A0A6A4WVX7_AMPAM|nr:fibrous sheath CABYR-binding protein-like [Amphibalanus amphitrite]XP_043204999.1 fibrous sheath CABYR-binding protein-like [Amphibalanus amphitrite]KAF0306508.1 Uridine diphosphate glucose pyrophosphatase [Amphibalanus amphitrite]